MGRAGRFPLGKGGSPGKANDLTPALPHLHRASPVGQPVGLGEQHRLGATKPEFFWRTAILGMGWVERTKNIQRTEAHAEGEMDMGTQEDGDTHGHKQRQTHVIRHT